MQTKGFYVGILAKSLSKSDGKLNISKFGKTVLFDWSITILGCKILRSRLFCLIMHQGWDIDDSGFLGNFNAREQQVSQVEMSEMVDGHAHFYVFFIQLSLGNHQTCIVYQNIYNLKWSLDILDELLHRGLFRQIELESFDASNGFGSRGDDQL